MLSQGWGVVFPHKNNQLSLSKRTEPVAIRPNKNDRQPLETVEGLCNQLKSRFAEPSEIGLLADIFDREVRQTYPSFFLPMGQSQREAISSVRECLVTIQDLLAKEDDPLASFHRLFQECDHCLKAVRSSHGEKRAEAIRQVQCLAARQWSLYGNQRQGKDDFNSLHLYPKKLDLSLAIGRALQALEDLKVIEKDDWALTLFSTHDGVRDAFGPLERTLSSLRSFDDILGNRGWQAVRELSKKIFAHRIPSASPLDAIVHGIGLLREASYIPGNLGKLLQRRGDRRSTEVAVKLMTPLERGIEAMGQLSIARSPQETFLGLKSVLAATMMLARLGSEGGDEGTVVGEDERLFALDIFLRVSPDVEEAIINAGAVYLCTPEVGGGDEHHAAHFILVGFGALENVR